MVAVLTFVERKSELVIFLDKKEAKASSQSTSQFLTHLLMKSRHGNKTYNCMKIMLA